jgi:hypothetical protein
MSLSVGKAIFEVGPAQADVGVTASFRSIVRFGALLSSDARDRPSSHPVRSGAEAVP